MFRDLIRGRFLGHPVHVMLVHFPTALFLLSFAFDVWGMITGDPGLCRASLYSMCLGLLGGVAAAGFGVADYVKLTGRESVFRKASWHAGIQTCVLMVFGVMAGIRLQDYPEPAEPGLTQLIVTGVTVLAMLTGNYLGGDLVFRDGVGVGDH